MPQMASAIRDDEETSVAPGADPMKIVLFWFSRDPIKNNMVNLIRQGPFASNGFCDQRRRDVRSPWR